jgi:DNA-binding HxlR family transcriptional regulator
MTQDNYRQFCPVAMAAEVLCNRWTVIVLRELIAGSTRFNELRRGVPRMSPALLSKRLKELEEAGIVRRVASQTEPGVLEYNLTRSGRDLKAIIDAIGIWGQRWVEANPTLQNLDADLLMWDMHRCINRAAMPDRRSVIEFIFPEQPVKCRYYWLVVTREGVDVCVIDPGFDVDLYVTVDLRTMTAVWLGLTSLRAAIAEEKITLTGSAQLSRSMHSWIGLSSFATEKKLASAG